MRGLLASGLVLVMVASVCGQDQPTEEQVTEAQKLQEMHHGFSVSCFNDCWALMDKAERTADDVENMMLLADASLWHWKQRADCTPANLSIGYWQVSRAHVLAQQYQMARLFGEKCLGVSQENGLPPFYVGYAYEALARAEVLNKDLTTARRYLAEARAQLEGVTDEEERSFLAADLDALDKMTAGK
jgi:hypothetical protein